MEIGDYTIKTGACRPLQGDGDGLWEGSFTIGVRGYGNIHIPAQTSVVCSKDRPRAANFILKRKEAGEKSGGRGGHKPVERHDTVSGSQ